MPVKTPCDVEVKPHFSRDERSWVDLELCSQLFCPRHKEFPAKLYNPIKEIKRPSHFLFNPEMKMIAFLFGGFPGGIECLFTLMLSEASFFP